MKPADLISFLFAACSVGIVCCAALWLLWETLASGLVHINWELLSQAPTNAGRDGGILPIIVSTFWVVLVCIGVSVPLGLGTAVWLAEFSRKRPRISRWVERSLDVLASVPSIVFGLFGTVFFCQILGMGYSILAGALTLTCMVLPILIRVTREGVASVPQEYRLGATALGVSKTTQLFRILLPSSMPSLAKGLILGIGRALAETAALIFTSGYETRMPRSLFDSGRTLSVHIYEMSMNVSGGNEKAYASAAVLVAMLLLIAMVTSVLTRWADTSSSNSGLLQGGLS